MAESVRVNYYDLFSSVAEFLNNNIYDNITKTKTVIKDEFAFSFFTSKYYTYIHISVFF